MEPPIKKRRRGDTDQSTGDVLVERADAEGGMFGNNEDAGGSEIACAFDVQCGKHNHDVCPSNVLRQELVALSEHLRDYPTLPAEERGLCKPCVWSFHDTK